MSATPQEGDHGDPVLPFVMVLALIIFCLIDVIQTPEDGVRNLPKWGWIVLIIIVPLIGSVAWLVAGRPQRPRTAGWRYGAGFPEAERAFAGPGVGCPAGARRRVGRP